MLPEFVQVGPIKYRMDTSQETLNKSKIASGATTLRGEIVYREQLIVIDPNQGPDSMAETVMHEVLHACVWNTGDTTGQEQLVSATATILLDTLRRNPDLVAFLMGTSEEANG
jgi:hypothetical protein